MGSNLRLRTVGERLCGPACLPAIWDVTVVPSSYLKAMQLTKQLEEKAKEAGKNRELAENEMRAAKELIEAARSNDIPYGKPEEFYAQASAAFDGKEYKNALALATKAKEEMEAGFSEFSMEIINSTETLLNLSKEIGAVSKTAEGLLENAKKEVEEKNFDKAISLGKESWEALEKKINEHMSQAFSSAQSMIVLARNSGEDVSEAEALLEEARAAMSAQEYENALTHLRECRKAVDTGISMQVEELTDEAKGYLITAKELDADVSRIEELLDKIDEDQTLGELEKALSTARLCKSEAEKTLGKALSDAIDTQDQNAESAAEIDADVDKAKEIINRARNALKNGNYGEAHTAITEATEEIHNSQFQKVLKTISASRSKFLKAKKFGADLDEAIEFLNKAREELKEGDYRGALDMAKKGDAVVDEIIAEFAELDDLIESVVEDMGAAKELGVDISEAQGLIEQAKEAIDDKDPDTAIELARKAKETLESAQYSFATEKIEMAELVITAGDQLGAYLDEPNEMMRNAIQAVKDSDFKSALEGANNAITRAEEIIKIHVQNTIASAELALGEAEGVDEDAINKLIDMAKRSFEMNAYDEAYVHADKALSMMETAQSAKARKAMEIMHESVRQAREMGCDVNALEENVNSCNEAIRNRDFSTALEVADKANKEAISLQFSMAEKEFGAAKLSVIEAKKLGIDITEMRDDLKMAKVAFDKKKFNITFKKSEEAKKKARQIIEKHQGAYDSMTQSAALVAEAKKSQLDVAGVMEMLLEAKKAFEAADYDKAKTLADNARQETDKLMAVHTSSEKVQKAKEYIPILESMDIDVSEVNKLIDDTNAAISKNDFESAVTLAEKTEHDILEILNSSITNVISGAESVIMDAKDVGIDITSPSEKLEKAKQHLHDSKFKEAIEYAGSAKGEVEQIRELSQKAAHALKTLQDSLKDVEGLYANLDDARAIQNQAMDALRSHDYEKAIDLAAKCLEAANKEVEAHVRTTIDDFSKAIEKAKADGAAVSSAEKLIKDARTAFDKKDFKTAVELAMRSEGELEKVSLQQDMATKAIKTAEGKLADAEAQGVFSRKAKSLLDMANQDIKSGDYVKALEHAIQSGDELHKVKEEFTAASESMDVLRSQLDVAVEIGAEVSIAKKLFNDAESAMKGYDYITAQEIAKEGLAEVRRISYSYLNNKISTAYKLIDLANKLNLGVSGLSSVLAEAKTFMDTGKFKVSNEKIGLCTNDLDEKLTAHVHDFISNVETAMTHAKEVGAAVSESEKLIKEAREKLEAKKYIEAMDLARKSMKGIADLKKGVEKEYLELTTRANTAITTAKKFGINVREAEGLFNIAKEKKSTDVRAAIDILNNCIKLAQAKLDDFRPRLEGNIVVDRVVKGQWVDSELVITNTGKTLGNDISIKILGDIEVQGNLHIDKIKGMSEEIRLPIKMKLEEPGEVHVILEMTSHRLLDNQKFVDKMTDSIIVTDEVAVEKSKDATFERLTAKADVKCSVCMGKVKAGTDIIKCSCGNTYHETCGSRFGKCTKCSNEFTAKLDRDAESELKDLDISTGPATTGDETKSTRKPEAKLAPAPAVKTTEASAGKTADDKKKDAPKKRLSLKL